MGGCAKPFELTIACCVVLFAACTASDDVAQDSVELPDAAPADRPNILPNIVPNIVLIVADDLGYTDIAPFGGEIRTPALERLARRGLRLTNMHASPMCAPSRAMLLTGRDNHDVGVGAVDVWLSRVEAARGHPGYEGYLRDDVETLAERLRDAGYFTTMAGKWHLGEAAGQSPAEHGFESSFALLPGGGSHFADRMGPDPLHMTAEYREDGKRVETLPADFFSSAFYTDRIIADIVANTHVNADANTDAGIDADRGRPFFAYLAFTAPHWPLQVPEAWRDRYAGRYDDGYDVLRERRIAEALRQGVIPPTAGDADVERLGPAWDELDDEQRRRSARAMELYAAMVENMDHHIGRLLDALESTGRYENTLIVFLSDNGADGTDVANRPGFLDGKDVDNRYQNLGRIGSFISLDPGWAQASSGPFRYFKGVLSEGGSRVPAIVSHGSIGRQGSSDDNYLTVMDVAPTLLELAGIEPSSISVEPGVRTAGMSFLEMLQSTAAVTVRPPGSAIGWEIHGNKALVEWPYKLVIDVWPYGDREWGLYNLADDPGEQVDLSARHPELRDSLLEKWHEYARNHEVLVLDLEALPAGIVSNEE